MKRWPIDNAFFWESYPFFRLLLPFAAGILGYYQGWVAGVSLQVFLVSAIVSFVLLAGVVLSKRIGDTLNAVMFLLLMVCLFSAGVTISASNDIHNNKAWYGNSIDHNKLYLARISSTPDEKENSWKMQVSLLDVVDSTQKLTRVTGRAFLYVQKTKAQQKLTIGDTVILPGRWEPLRDAGNPFEFSYATYCAHNNILYRQWCAPYDVQLYAAGDPAALPLTETAHNWCMHRIEHYLGAHQAKGLLQAMLLGDDVNLDENLRQSYAETGIVHIIAISGGNVGMFFIAISFVLGWLGHKKYQRLKYGLALPIIWFYVLMAGAEPSALRAAMMFSLLAIGIIRHKENLGINHLLATAFLLLCAEPAWLFSVGFQLSFVAVLSIMLFFDKVYSLLPWAIPKATGKGVKKVLQQGVYNIPVKLWGAIAMSIAAEILLAPLVVYYFHSFPVMFLVANVAAFMFMGIVLVQSMIMLALSGIPGVASGIANVISHIVDIFSSFVMWLQKIGPRQFNYLMLSGVEVALLYVAIAGMAWFLIKHYKGAFFASLSATCLLLVCFCLNEWDRLHHHALVVYNTAHTSHIELVDGSGYSTLYTDTAASRQSEYASRPAHIGWSAWDQQPTGQKEVFSIGGKTALILNHPVTGDQHFPVDYLILNDTGRVDMPELLRTFSPRTVVAGNNYSRREVAAITKACNGAGVQVHVVADKGAFVLSN